LLDQRVVVFDGATGTRLYDRGIFLNRCFDELNVSAPDVVEAVHRDYIEVGCDVIETNTFGANRRKLEQHGLGDQVEAINEAGARIARRVAGDERLVAGAIGPLGIRIEPWGPTSLEEAAELFAAQASALTRGEIDLFAVETFFDLAEVEAAVQGIRAVSELPIVVHMTLEDDGNSLEGVAPEVFGRRLARLPVDAVGVNCSVGPAAMLTAVERLASVVTLPISAQPNAGKPRVVDNRNMYLCSPEYMATFARRMIRAGARILGGCCGTTPEHLLAIRRAARSLEPERRKVEAKPIVEAVEEEDAKDPIPFPDRSRFAARLDSRAFPISVEMLPPRGHELDRTMRGARRLSEAGIDLINIPDGPRASARMSPAAMAIRIERDLDIETLIHYCCRDRNLLGMQSDLLGAHALGLRNVLLVTGDPPKLGDYPDATAVFDVDSIGLANMVGRLNRGLDVGGNTIGAPTGFCYGVGADPGAADMAREIARLEWKVEAGAQFVITQPVFDRDTFAKFFARIEHLDIPLMAGVWPLASYRNAEFMNNEVPGVHVPDDVMKRMRGAETKEAARREGIEVAREMILELLSVIDGVQVAAPFGRVRTALEVVEVVPEERRKMPATPAG
jgi:homocysteine S-methyltransferase